MLSLNNDSLAEIILRAYVDYECLSMKCYCSAMIEKCDNCRKADDCSMAVLFFPFVCKSFREFIRTRSSDADLYSSVVYRCLNDNPSSTEVLDLVLRFPCDFNLVTKLTIIDCVTKHQFPEHIECLKRKNYRINIFNDPSSIIKYVILSRDLRIVDSLKNTYFIIEFVCNDNRSKQITSIDIIETLAYFLIKHSENEVVCRACLVEKLMIELCAGYSFNVYGYVNNFDNNIETILNILTDAMIGLEHDAGCKQAGEENVIDNELISSLINNLKKEYFDA